ncbi:MAG: response regulator [Cyclobacteriaceae bacterium]|nr:response regulator [Cyclobacteriaceae bacterium]
MAASLYIVEDDEIYAQFLKANFKGEYEVFMFISAEDCLEAIKGHGHTPDVMILDYNLPGMSGIDLYDRLKPTYPRSKFIMLSSIDDGTQVLEFIKKGVNDYVVKDDSVISSLQNVIKGEDKFTLS